MANVIIYGMLSYQQTRPTPSVPKLRELVMTKYGGSQTAAAKAWDADQSTVSKVLSGKRTAGFDLLTRIARAENVEVQALYEPAASRLTLLPQNDVNRFRYNRDEPGAMIDQMLEWFSALPEAVRARVAVAVMRALADHGFNELNPPPESWVFAVRRVGGVL